MAEIIIHSTELDNTFQRLDRVSKQRPIFPSDRRNLKEIGKEASMLKELKGEGRLIDPNTKTLNGLIAELQFSESETQNKPDLS